MPLPRRTSGGGAGNDMLYLLLFWIMAYVSAILAEKSHLSPLLFYLLFGCIMINCHIIENTPFLDGLAEVAITIVFFALGFEENVKNFLSGIKKAWGIASIGAIVPFACGFGCAALFFPDEGIKPHLMCGLAFTATAVSLTMITLKNEGLAVSRAAIGIMTSAVLDDVAALALVAIMVPIATGAAEPTVLGIGFILFKSFAFFSVIIFFNMVVFPHDITNTPIIKHIPLVRSIGVHHILRFHGGEQAVIGVLCIGFGVGHMATAFDFHPAIGAYMAGLILEERYFDLQKNVHEEHAHGMMPQLPDSEEGAHKDAVADAHASDGHKENVYHHVADILENVAFCWIGPVFFLHLGAQILIDVEVLKNVIVQSLVIFVCLFFGQISSASFAARYVPGGFTFRESMMIGFGMLGRAELFFVVLNICYIENNIFSTEMFFACTFAAMLLNISVPITISLWKPYYTGEKNIPGMKPLVRDTDATPEEASGADPGLLVSPDVLEVGWLQEKATKRTSQQARRVQGSMTGQEGPAGVPVRLSQTGAGGGDASLECGVVRVVSGELFVKGCGVPGCNKKVCVLCKYIGMDNGNSSRKLSEGANIAREQSKREFLRLAYEDAKQDLAANDHGRTSDLERTVSDPAMLHVCEMLCRQGGASISGATGAELAREVRQYLEGEKGAEQTTPYPHGRAVSGMSSTGLKTEANVADEWMFPPRKPICPQLLTAPRAP